MNLGLFTQSLLAGVTNGLTYALIGIGLAAIFKGSRVPNAMQGEPPEVKGIRSVQSQQQYRHRAESPQGTHPEQLAKSVAQGQTVAREWPVFNPAQGQRRNHSDDCEPQFHRSLQPQKPGVGPGVVDESTQAEAEHSEREQVERKPPDGTKAVRPDKYLLNARFKW